MTDHYPSERLLELNAALDDELDAMSSLEFERELGDDRAFAADYRRLTTLRDAVRRHAPREAAPQALADRIAALTASALAAPPPQTVTAPTATVVPFRRRAWLDSRALAMAASFAVLGFAVGAGLTSLRTPAGSGDVAQHLGVGFCARRDCWSALRRRLLRPAYGQTLARQPHNGQRNHRRSRGGGLSAGRRARDHRRPGPHADSSFIDTTSTFSR